MKASTQARATSRPMIRAPIASTFASLCSRPRRAATGIGRLDAADAVDLVGHDLLARAAAAEHDAALAVACGDRSRGRRDVVGIVDRHRVGVDPEVDHLVAVRSQPVGNRCFERKAGVVGGQGDAHGRTVASATVGGVLNNSIKLFTIRGIEVGVHYSWLIIFALLTWSLSTYMLPVAARPPAAARVLGSGRDHGAAALRVRADPRAGALVRGPRARPATRARSRSSSSAASRT